jgi:heavy metal sensor kinase
VKKIIEAAKKITAEDLSHRIESIGSKDEIGELAETFNDMISRIERSFKQIKQFSSDTSHELKTPLAAIRGEIEVALRKERGREEYKKILKSALEEIDKLQKIIDNLLLLAQMDSQNIKLSFKEIQLDEILLEAFEEIETLAKKKKLSLILKKIDQTGMKGDEILIKRLFVNLIDNAIKYTQEGGKVEIALEKEGDSAKFTVEDTGIGIPENRLPYIFDRFYRVDKARSRETGGCGLGLALAKWIAETHKGKIEVKSKVGEGSIFVVSFPLQD